VYKRTTNYCGIGVILDKNGLPITNGQAKADVFNNCFSSVGVADNGIMPCCNPVTLHTVLHSIELHTVLHSIEIRAPDVIRSISKLKTNSSCGPDRLPAILFKRLKHCLSQPLALIYNQLVCVGAVPADWPTAHIAPVFKKGTAGD